MTNEELIAAYNHAFDLAGIYDKAFNEPLLDLDSQELVMSCFFYWDEEYGRLQDLMKARGLLKEDEI